MSKSIGWLVNDTSLPSNRIRCVLLRDALEKNHFNSQILPLPREPEQLELVSDKIAASDIVILRKNLPRVDIIRKIAKNAEYLVYDVDDAIRYQVSYTSFAAVRLLVTFRYLQMMRAAKIVIAGNSILAKEARRFGARSVFELPSAVPVNVPQKTKTNETLVLGWIGSGVNLPFLSMLEPLFLELEEGGLEFELRIISNGDFRFGRFSRYRFIPWSIDTQEKEIAEFDIGLMPMTNNAFTRGKCAYKALQYAAAGVPTVSSDVGVTSRFLGSGALMASNNREFLQALRRLAADQILRREIGAAGRDRVVKYFSVDVIADRLIDILAGQDVNPEYFPD